MDRWEEDFPDEIRPQSEVFVPVVFWTSRLDKFWLDYGEVTYEVFDNAGLSLAKFTIVASASESKQSPVCCPTFIGRIQVNWDTLPKVFGVQVLPRNGEILFRKNGTVTLNVMGNVLLGGLRSDDSDMKLTDWKSWQELQPDCQPGDVCGVNRGNFRHYGVVERIESDGTVIVSHLTGSAGELLQRHGLGGVKQMFNAITGSHGDIAMVQTQTLQEFAGKDPCRVENLHDDRWKPYQVEVLLNRIQQATGVRDYSLFEFNCEHYANLIRYGMPYSVQIEEMKYKFALAERGKAFFDKEIAQRGKAVWQEKTALITQQVSQSATNAITAVRTEWTNVTTTISDRVRSNATVV